MAEVIKKELLLEGLNCNKCLDSIANSIKLKNIDFNIDYQSKNLRFIVNGDKEYQRVIKYVNDVLENHEHSLKISEKEIDNSNGKTLFIGKLTCSNCARKIETKVRNLAGVESADLDFVNSKLNIVTKTKADMSRVVEESKKIVKTVEPDAVVHEKSEKPKREEHDHGDSDTVRETILTLILGVIPLVLGLFLNVDFIYELGLFLLSYIIIGNSVIKKAISSIIRGDIFNENTLMMIATIGAFAIKEFHEAVAVMAFYLIGEMFQDLAVDKSRKSISKLMDLNSSHANLLIGDKVIDVNPEDVDVKSLIVVKPGEKVPLDGVVVQGESYIDTSSITGESNPRYIGVDSQVLSGFINLNEVLVIKTTKKYSDSTVSKIIEMVENASSRKAPTENFITKFARYYTPTVVFIALLLAVLPPLILGDDFSIWIYRALSFLVVSCPCALVISVPLGFYGGIGFASRNGVLIKGGNYLEALRKSEEIIFDKTGTLTTGKFVIESINTVSITKDELLEIAAYAEYYSIHPIAAVIKETYKKDIDVSKIIKYQDFAGQGIKAHIKDDLVLIGNELLLKNNNVEYSKNNASGTILYIAINNKYVGNIVIVDKVKEEAKKTIEDLKGLGFKKVTMVTGDVESVATNVASRIGIDEVHAEVLPTDKVEILENKVKNSRGKTIFVGDGINDAPVLAVADIGISMGAVGSDAAIEASDIVIMNDDLSKIVDAITIAKKTSKVVWQNIFFALFVKITVLVFASLGIINMWIAVFADVGVSLIAILNATRILKMKLKAGSK